MKLAQLAINSVSTRSDDRLETRLAAYQAAGFGKAQDRLPEFMSYEPLPPHNGVWDVSDAALDAVYGEL